MASWVTFVFLAIVLFIFLAVTPLDPAKTGVINRAAASTDARTAGTTQRPATLFRCDINPSFGFRARTRAHAAHICTAPGGQTGATRSRARPDPEASASSSGRARTDRPPSRCA